MHRVFHRNGHRSPFADLHRLDHPNRSVVTELMAIGGPPLPDTAGGQRRVLGLARIGAGGIGASSMSFGMCLGITCHFTARGCEWQGEPSGISPGVLPEPDDDQTAIDGLGIEGEVGWDVATAGLRLVDLHAGHGVRRNVVDQALGPG